MIQILKGCFLKCKLESKVLDITKLKSALAFLEKKHSF